MRRSRKIRRIKVTKMKNDKLTKNKYRLSINKISKVLKILHRVNK